jgi:23S rRNA (adenine2030-N6)-methyltransferase
VLIDPPFEEAGEFDRLIDGLVAAARRFATGTIMLWYPVKDARAVARFHRELAKLGHSKLMVAELSVRAVPAAGELSATGLVVLNPPFTLPAKLALLLPFLAARLARGKGAQGRLEWLSGNSVTSL